MENEMYVPVLKIILILLYFCVRSEIVYFPSTKREIKSYEDKLSLDEF